MSRKIYSRFSGFDRMSGEPAEATINDYGNGVIILFIDRWNGHQWVTTTCEQVNHHVQALHTIDYFMRVKKGTGTC